MNWEEKEEYVRFVIRNVEDAILKRVPDMPEHWNGNQLSLYIAEKFAGNCRGLSGRAEWKKARITAYKAEVRERNL
jgi:hypothetical protein